MRRPRHIEAAVLAVAILAGCGGTTDLAAPSAPPVSTAPATVAAPTPSDTSQPTAAATPAPIATPVPAWRDYPVPDARRATVEAVGADGTVYLATFADTTGLDETDVQLIALGPDGVPRADWSSPTIPPGSVIAAARAAADGSLYVVLGPDQFAENLEAPSLTVMRLDSDGSVAPGWPVRIDSASLTSGPVLVWDELCFAWAPARNEATVECLAADGSRPAGWPLVFDANALVGPSPAPDGPLYLSTYQISIAAGPTFGSATIDAYGSDGRLVSGWQSYQAPKKQISYVAPVAGGLLELRYDAGLMSGQVTLTWRNSDGTPSGPTARGPKGDLYPTLTVGSDGTPYVAYGNGGWATTDGAVANAGRGIVVAYGMDGKPKPGWPVSFKGWPQNGSGIDPLPVGPDGSVWVVERMNGFGAVVHHLGPDGTELLGKPLALTGDFFMFAVTGPDGTLYTTDRSDGTTKVIAVKARG